MNKVWIRQNKLLLGKMLLLLIVLLVLMSGLTVLGCAGGSAKPIGWSGVAVADETLFLGSMEGKLVALNTSNGNRLWEVTLEASKPAGGFGCASSSLPVAIYGTPAVSEDLIYVGAYVRAGNEDYGKIYAYRFGKNEARWEYPRQDNLGEPVVGGAIVSQGKVYIACADGKVYALDAAEGYKEWEFSTGGAIWSNPAIAGGTLFIGSFDKKLYAIDVTNGSKEWEFETQGAIAATPLVYNNTVYVGSFDRHLYAVNAIDGSLIWESSFVADKWFWAQPMAYNNNVYAGCLDGKVYVVDAKSGDKVAELELESPIASSPVLVDGSIIFASQEGQVWAVDTGSNSKRLLVDLKEKIYAPLCASKGVIYIHTQKKDTVYALNPQTGVALWNLSLGSR